MSEHAPRGPFRRRRLAGAERGSRASCRGSPSSTPPLSAVCEPTEHAQRGRFHALERRHGLAEIAERGAGVSVERSSCRRLTRLSRSQGRTRATLLCNDRKLHLMRRRRGNQASHRESERFRQRLGSCTRRCEVLSRSRPDAHAATADVNKWWEILYQMNIADGALLNETAWSALVGMSKKNAREAAKAELAAE